ncbi:hypothetical protein BC830DRAFT_39795 [Chytriomyces sp. MP71]|nr:hypothetical protein BC830DRAFT_39795 [Chytriomyces sp. MP71]
MIWVNNHPCDACGATDTVGIGSGSPTQADLADGADRVELYSCQQCKTVTRFPRFNNVLRLMKTRKGRCGEWANLFTLFSCAMGYETRYVMDFTDHVWCEFYSETYGRWVNVDPSEGSGSIDQPLMYEAGWGKKLTYIFAIGEYEVVDVFRRYTRDVPAMLKRRNLAREIIISQLTSDITQSLRRTLPASLVQSLRERDTKELEELLNPPARPLRQSETMGRKSGNLDWRTARGETGSIFSASNARSVPQLSELTYTKVRKLNVK